MATHRPYKALHRLRWLLSELVPSLEASLASPRTTRAPTSINIMSNVPSKKPSTYCGDTGYHTPVDSPIEDVEGQDVFALTSEWIGAQGANTIQVFNALGLDLGSPAPASPQRADDDDESFVFPWLMPAPVSVPMPPTWTLGPPARGTDLAIPAPPLTPPHTSRDGSRALRRFRPAPLGRRRFIAAPEDKVRKTRTAGPKAKALRKSLDLARRLRGPTTVFPQGTSVEINSPNGRHAVANAQGGHSPSTNEVMPHSEANRVADKSQSM